MNSIHKNTKVIKISDPIAISQDRSSKGKLMQESFDKEVSYGFGDDSMMQLNYASLKLPKPSNKVTERFKKAVKKIALNKNKKEKSLREVMEGRVNSFQKGFFTLFIEPYSFKYRILRYSRAVCIFANFFIIPTM